ncbi:MAG: hypothetical protein COX51_06400 [Syntrophobacteraceae bacterium CG23_combo_of_CG06-09_8_20_14_all_50_8]|nr:MAG: hypothetical protein COX51_06400 [Syntrophobacteraceae bacterium CG23_combo_of_CG06-09_8_20_14_all_50_8]
MSDKISIMGVDTIKKRTKWAIDYVVRKEHLSNIKLAEKMGIAAGTINTYRRMATVPNIEFILKFCKIFNFSQPWFILGIGYPFLKAWETHPESKGPTLLSKLPDLTVLFGPDEKAPFDFVVQRDMETHGGGAAQLRKKYIRETTADYNAHIASAPFQEFRISEALTMAARVLESGTSYATSLYLNIQHFDCLIAAEARIARVESSQRDFETRTHARLQEMEEKIEQLNQTAASGGGS